MFTLHEIVKRNDNGRKVRIVDVWPVGLSGYVFCRIEDVETEAVAVLDARDLRAIVKPIPKASA